MLYNLFCKGDNWIKEDILLNTYFIKTEVDRIFYSEYLEERMPSKIFDAHVHINLKSHVEGVTPERIKTDWALECGIVLPCEDAYACAEELYPGVEYKIAGMPWPIKEADLKANNEYLAQKKSEGKLTPFMSLAPDWDIEETEEVLVNGGFIGFKPYPDMVSGKKGADISIFDFITREQLKLLDKHKRALMLHLPRKERLADPDNVRELMEIRDRFPEIKIIIAHFGRAFCPYYLEKGIEMMSGAEGFYFDTTAVINPAVYRLAFEKIPVDKILYGSDMPILFWHGKRKWTEREYINLCRENFSWNKHLESPEEEAKYTFFLYEQMKSILDTADEIGFTGREKDKIFFDNLYNLVNNI